MDTCLDLIALQYTCMIVMAMLAFFVFVSRYYVTCRNRQFEQSRWMIVVALLLFVVHYMCQMRLGWRQQGNDVGVLFNLLFYSPSAILLSWSQLNILRAGNTKEKKWESKWTRSDVSSVSMIPAVSIKSEMVFVCGWNDASGWEVTGLDWKSGATRHRSILGKNNRANGAYAIIQYLANGDLLFNSVAGPIRVKY